MKRRETRGRTAAVGLDLGSTYIKAGRLDERGDLVEIQSLATPVLSGTGTIREGDAASYLLAARHLLASMSESLPRGTPLGITSQRSSFTLWDRKSGEPRTPLVSWQDRRAAGWCARHEALEPEVVRRSGLLLSAHYAGPKLAKLQEVDPDLERSLHAGSLLFGTLETFLVWNWSRSRDHETDLTMAARTAMVDLGRSEWSPELLDHYNVPAAALPRLVPSSGRVTQLDLGLTLTATLADQASGALAVFAEGQDSVLVNLGTGAFVLRPTREGAERRRGYLTGPIFGGSGSGHRYALEGTINGAGPALDRFGDGPTLLPEIDPAPDAFALPDLAGLGSPHWRPELGLTLSRSARGLTTRDQRRVVLEGLLFRVLEILDDLGGSATGMRVLLAGGLTGDPGIAPGLAALLHRPVELVREQQCSLLGVTRLAAGLAPFADSPTLVIEPGTSGSYLREKHGRWKAWLARLLARGRLRQRAPIGNNG